MSTTQNKHGRKYDEEFKRPAAALASQPGKTDEAVGRDLGVSAWSVSRWRRQYGAAKTAGGLKADTPAAGPLPPGAAELERENRALRRENEDLRQQRTILSLNRSTGFLGLRCRSPSLQTFLRGLHPGGVGEHAHVLQRPTLPRGEGGQPLGGGQGLVGIHRV